MFIAKLRLVLLGTCASRQPLFRIFDQVFHHLMLQLHQSNLILQVRFLLVVRLVNTLIAL